MARFRPEILSDEVLAALAASAANGGVPNAAEKAAIDAEVARRKASSTVTVGWGAPAPNVAANLDAAASPMTTEPTAGPKKTAPAKSASPKYAPPARSAGEWQDQRDLYRRGIGLQPDPEARETEDETRFRFDSQYGEGAYDEHMARQKEKDYAAKHREGLRNFRSPEAVEEGRRQQAGYNAATGMTVDDAVAAGGATVDGFELPPVRDSAGNVLPGRYSLRDLAQAKRDQAESQRQEAVRGMTDSDIAKYGDYRLRDDDPRLTDAQRKERQTRKEAEGRATEQRAQLRADRHALATRPLTAPEQADKAKKDAAHAIRVRRAQAANNPLEYMGRDDVNDWQKMVMAERFLRQPQTMTPLGVQAVGGENALGMLRGMNLGQGMQNNPLVNAQAAAAEHDLAQRKREANAADEDTLGEKYAPGHTLPWWLGGGYDEFTIAEQQQMVQDLIARGYSEAEAQAAVDRQAQKRRASEPARWNE
jgi:hypothetical protein